MLTQDYTFPAVRGIQAGCLYYTVMCPLRLIPSLFADAATPDVPPEERAQRDLTRSRIPKIARYLRENPERYVLSAITAAIDMGLDRYQDPFQSAGTTGPLRDTGQLHIPASATLTINDGQHRVAAIIAALQAVPSNPRHDMFRDEHIPIVFFVDAGLARNQQRFADLNQHAVRPSPSLRLLYDIRDPLAGLTRHIATTVPIFTGRTEFGQTNIAPRSDKLFTLSGIHHATMALLGKRSGATITPEEEDQAVTFWTTLGQIIPEWQPHRLRNLSSAEWRADYVIFHNVLLQALGLAGAALIAQEPETWPQRLQVLDAVDWSRHNTNLWEGRAMLGGQMSKARPNVLRTATVLKQILGVALTEQEQHDLAMTSPVSTEES